MAVGELGVSRTDPDAPTLDVLTDVLNGFGGSLFNQIRSRQVSRQCPFRKAPLLFKAVALDADPPWTIPVLALCLGIALGCFCSRYRVALHLYVIGLAGLVSVLMP